MLEDSFWLKKMSVYEPPKFFRCILRAGKRIGSIGGHLSPVEWVEVGALSVGNTVYKKLALNSGIQTYQISTNDDKVCLPSLSSILLDVKPVHR